MGKNPEAETQTETTDKGEAEKLQVTIKELLEIQDILIDRSDNFYFEIQGNGHQIRIEAERNDKNTEDITLNLESEAPSLTEEFMERVEKTVESIKEETLESYPFHHLYGRELAYLIDGFERDYLLQGPLANPGRKRVRKGIPHHFDFDIDPEENIQEKTGPITVNGQYIVYTPEEGLPGSDYEGRLGNLIIRPDRDLEMGYNLNISPPGKENDFELVTYLINDARRYLDKAPLETDSKYKID